ncbi:Nicotinate/Quinolinate PRTase C-terminal domain-like protein, partial [Violaceomyces palustris]
KKELACEKAKRLVEEGIQFSEFGTRRRRSFQVQEMVIQGLIRGCNESGGGGTTKGKLVGTSNLDLARKYGLDAIGTVAHEWTMAVAALKGYQASNLSALKAWDECYSPPPSASRNPNHDLTIALTDTFSSEVFFRDLSSQPEGVEMMRRWRGLRQDSGDPKRFAERARDFYQSIGIQPSSKVIIYSDNLNVEKSIELHRHSNSIGIRAGFGIGTNLTNDFTTRSSNRERSKPLNIVIKLDTIDDRPTVKISDDLTKNTGDPEQVR